MFNWLKNIFNKALALLRDLLKQVFTNSTEVILAALREVAVDAVTRMAGTDLSNPEKRSKAFAEIKAYAQAKGIVVRDSLIYLLIEIVVNKLKNAEER